MAKKSQPINPKLLDKYSKFMGEREDYVELNIRGEKARKIAELAEVVKWMSVHKPSEAVKIPIHDFERAYGVGKKGIVYVKLYLKKFGIPFPRICPSQDLMNIWSKGPVTNG